MEHFFSTFELFVAALQHLNNIAVNKTAESKRFDSAMPLQEWYHEVEPDIWNHSMLTGLETEDLCQRELPSCNVDRRSGLQWSSLQWNVPDGYRPVIVDDSSPLF